MEAKDYFKHYIGQQVHDFFDEEVSILYGVSLDGVTIKRNVLHQREFDEVKLMLRPIWMIKQGELIELFRICYQEIYGHDLLQDDPKFVQCGAASIEYSEPTDKLRFDYDMGLNEDGRVDFCCNGSELGFNKNKATLYLLEKGFDIFKLIENNVAIDKTRAYGKQRR